LLAKVGKSLTVRIVSKTLADNQLSN